MHSLVDGFGCVRHSSLCWENILSQNQTSTQANLWVGIHTLRNPVDSALIHGAHALPGELPGRHNANVLNTLTFYDMYGKYVMVKVRDNVWLWQMDYGLCG